MGLPDEKTTTVGFPVSMIAWTRWGMAPTKFREATSTCSPVVALRPCHNSY